MATHSSVLDWKIPGMVETGGLPSIGSHSEVKVAQSCMTLCDPMDFPWNSLGQITGVGSLSLLQGIIPNPEIEPKSPTLQADSWATREAGPLRIMLNLLYSSSLQVLPYNFSNSATSSGSSSNFNSFAISITPAVISSNKVLNHSKSSRRAGIYFLHRQGRFSMIGPLRIMPNLFCLCSLNGTTKPEW